MREMDGFIDRSKVRILLCDNDSKGSGEVFTLLRKCSYQVISVKSPRQVIDALNAEGPNIDLILSEVDLPMAKGLKMLKYIMRKESQLQRIPVIMMSAQDEVTLVVKCLRLGAADYLVKPLRTNELLNLWTHMWRRRRMLGLTEIKLMNCEFDLVHSDHSDVNTNSTVFSDDTDERPRKNANQDISVSIHHENQINVILSNNQSYLPETKNHQQGCGPKKSELKMGESSAFFTYIKSNMSTKSKTTPVVSILDKQPCTDDQNNSQKIIMPRVQQNHSQTQLFHSSSNNSHLSSVSIDDSTPPVPTESQFPKPQIQQGYTRHSAYPYHLHDPTNQFMMSHNNHFPNYNYNNHQIHGMMTSSFPYYYQQQQGGAHPHTWGMMKKVESRREAALEKFRKKRKERCYDKKIRYVNRKKLAERRPRVRGQFVRKVNGIDVDLNGYPTASNDFDEYREEEDDDDDDEVLKK